MPGPEAICDSFSSFESDLDNDLAESGGVMQLMTDGDIL